MLIATFVLSVNTPPHVNHQTIPLWHPLMWGVETDFPQLPSSWGFTSKVGRQHLSLSYTSRPEWGLCFPITPILHPNIAELEEQLTASRHFWPKVLTGALAFAWFLALLIRQ